MSWTLRRTVPLLGVQSDSGPSPGAPGAAHNMRSGASARFNSVDIDSRRTPQSSESTHSTYRQDADTMPISAHDDTTQDRFRRERGGGAGYGAAADRGPRGRCAAAAACAWSGDASRRTRGAPPTTRRSTRSSAPPSTGRARAASSGRRTGSAGPGAPSSTPYCMCTARTKKGTLIGAVYELDVACWSS